MDFQGLYIPYVTPFDDSGAIDVASLERLTKYFTALPTVTGLVSTARIGEGTVQTWDEKLEVYKHTGQVCRSTGKIHVATIAPQSTDEAIRMINDVEKLPVDAVMIFPPLLFAWGKVGGELKFRFWEDVIRATKLPLFMFQIPVQNYWYDVDTICRIAKFDRVVAFKEASFSIDLFTDTVKRLKAQNSHMHVLSGNDKFVGKSYEIGSRGSLIGISNLATEKWGEMDAAGRAGNFAKALALQEELKDLSELVFGEPLVEAVARIKIILQHQGLIKSALVRRPQLGVSPEEKKALIASFDALMAKKKVVA